MFRLDPKWRDRLFLLGALALMIAFSIDSSCRRGNTSTRQYFESRPFFGRKLFQSQPQDTAARPRPADTLAPRP